MRTLCILFLLTCGTPGFAAPPKLTLATGLQNLPDELPEAVKKRLSQDAATVSDAAGAVLTVWFSTEFSSTANAEQIKNGLTYREIPEGSLLGVVKLEKQFIDYRKQEIPAGLYTLRLAAQPETGDHKDTAPHTDFALLVPAAIDTSKDSIEVQELVKLSLKATGGDHPGVMLLYPNTGKSEQTELAEEAGGVAVVRTRRPLQANGQQQSFGLSIVVAGFSKMR
jgi:hypothetical protein